MPRQAPHLLQRNLLQRPAGFPPAGVTQLASLLAWSSLPGNERFQRVLSIIVCLGLFLMPCLAPSWYIRRRQAVLVGFRWAQPGIWRVPV